MNSDPFDLKSFAIFAIYPESAMRGAAPEESPITIRPITTISSDSEMVISAIARGIAPR